MGVRRRARLVALGSASVVLVGVAAVSVGTASATAVAPFGDAWVWANQPTVASYTPNTNYQYNSAHRGSAVNTVTRSGTGAYAVHLPDLGSASGTVLVTAYGVTTDYCKVLRWTPESTTTQNVYVQCYSLAGTPVDSQFTMTYTNRLNGPRAAYLWADQPGSSSYTPRMQYQANGVGGTNTITREGTGDYVVDMPVDAGASPATGNGDIGVSLATAYGPGNASCHVGGIAWSQSRGDEARVLCSAPGGTPVGSMFTLTHVRQSNLLGDTVPSMYVLDNFSAASVTVTATGDSAGDSVWSSVSGNDVIERLSTGRFAVHTPVNLSMGDAQVNAYGLGADAGSSCKVESWMPSAGIVVRCVDRNGSPTNAMFELSFAAGVTG